MLENKEILINGILNLYSITHNIFSEDYFLRRRMTRKEKDFLIKRNINADTPLEFVKSNVERYVNNFYSELIVDDKLFDKYNSEQKVRLNNLNDLIKASKQDTINTIIDTYSRILNEGKGYIESYLKFEQKLSEMVSDLETDINSISGQIENCMLLWDYGNKGKVRYRLIANADSCKECKEHNGKELLTDDFKENEFFPFVHPNCRCQIEVLDQNGNIIAVINPQPKKLSESATNIYQIVLDAISNALTAAALIPGADTFVDIAAIPVDLLRGDFLSAGLDAVGAIPFVGEAADTAKLAKAADNAIDAVKVAKNTELFTAKQATEAAKKLGFFPIGQYSHGQPIFKKGNKYITPDIDSHNGGIWKMADSIKGLRSKKTRLGTYDANLKRIGD